MKRKLLPYDQWPLTDQQAWKDATRSCDIFTDGGVGSHWSDGSKKTIRYGYSRWLGYLILEEPCTLSMAPANRVAPERLKRYIDHLQGSITPAGTHNYVKHLYDAIHAMAPEDDWRWLRELAHRLGILVTPRNKRPRMVSSHKLAELGCRLMAAAEDDDSKDIERAILYRDGLMIAMLALRPIRRRNLSGIRIGVNLLFGPTGYRLRFEPHETKTHTLVEHPLPDWLVAPINRYLDFYRPLFPGALDHDGLWASAKGCVLRSEGIYDRIALHTKNTFGHVVNPHLFRHCVATTIALEDPEHVHIAADLLGHTSLAMTERHYIQAQTREAGKAYQSVVRDLHCTLRQRYQQA
jgi:integrase/recombinase XerD